MKIKFLFFSLFAFALSFQAVAQCGSHAKSNAQVKTVAQGPTDDIIDIAMSSDDFATLVAAVKAAGLVETLQSDGPFTVFAPTNAAFDKLPEGTVATLLKPENKPQLAKILTYHVVAGEFMAADVLAAINKSGGKFSIETVSGGTLVASLKGGKVILTDENGNISTVAQTDVDASNGVIHVIDTVVLPK